MLPDRLSRLSHLALACLVALLATLAGCAELEDPTSPGAPSNQLDDPEGQVDDSTLATSSTSQEIETGCGNVPPCACALRGTPACLDDDNDSILNLNDNCPLASNAGQANCDGDVYGDACDPESAYVANEYATLSFSGYESSLPFCQGVAPFRRLAYYLFRRDLRTLHTTVQFCGPSGTGSEERTSTSFVYSFVQLVVTTDPC